MNPAGHYSNLDHRIILYNVLIDSFPVSGVIPTCQQSGLSGNRTGWKIRASPSVEGPRDAVSEKTDVGKQRRDKDRIIGRRPVFSMLNRLQGMVSSQRYGKGMTDSLKYNTIFWA